MKKMSLNRLKVQSFITKVEPGSKMLGGCDPDFTEQRVCPQTGCNGNCQSHTCQGDTLYHCTVACTEAPCFNTAVFC